MKQNDCLQMNTLQCQIDRISIMQIAMTFRTLDHDLSKNEMKDESLLLL